LNKSIIYGTAFNSDFIKNKDCEAKGGVENRRERVDMWFSLPLALIV